MPVLSVSTPLRNPSRTARAARVRAHSSSFSASFSASFSSSSIAGPFPWFGVSKCLLALIIAGAIALAYGQPASAQTGTITVTTTAPAANADGACSLVEAVDNANAAAAVHGDCTAGGPTDTIIQLAAGEVYSFTTPHNNTQGNNGLPVVSANITVAGNAATLARTQQPPADPMRFFYVEISGTLTLEDLTLTGGNPIVGGTVVLFADGGAIYNAGALHLRNATLHQNGAANGGAIYTDPGSTLTVHGSTLHDNQAVLDGGAIAAHGNTHLTDSTLYANGATGGRGGALSIMNAGTDAAATVQTSTLYANTADQGGGAILAQAALSYTTALTVSQSTIMSNSVGLLTGMGGGILAWADGGLTTRLVDSTLRANSAGNGGAIAGYTNVVSPTGTLQLVLLRSLVAANIANDTTGLGGNGGGIYHTGGTLVVANSTLSGNQAQGNANPDSGLGGAIANHAANHVADTATASGAQVEIVNSSLISNTASQAGGALSNLQGITVTAHMSVENTLFAFNHAPNPSTRTCDSDMAFSILSLGHNLESGNSCGFDQSSDILNTNPLIGPLADNGGPTWTHALLPSSPAIGTANAATCAAPPIDQHDQRGVLRLSVACDIGAYEFEVGKKLAPILMVNHPELAPEEEE